MPFHIPFLEKKPTITNEVGLTPEELAKFIDGVSEGKIEELQYYAKLSEQQRNLIQQAIEERIETFPEGDDKHENAVRAKEELLKTGI